MPIAAPAAKTPAIFFELFPSIPRKVENLDEPLSTSNPGVIA
jgi:hypothetical protein